MSVTSAKTFSQFWKELPAFVKLIIIVVILFLLFLLIRYLYKQYQAKKTYDLLNQGSVTVQTTSGATGQPQIVTVDLGTKASSIKTAFYDNDIFGMTEDEQRAKQEILSVPKSLIPDLSDIYFKLTSGKILKQDYQKFLSTTDWNDISYLFS